MKLNNTRINHLLGNLLQTVPLILLLILMLDCAKCEE